MLEILPVLAKASPVINSIITGLLSDKAKTKLNKLLRPTLEDLFKKAVKLASADLKDEKRKQLRAAFEQSKVQEAVLTFENSTQPIPDSFFVDLFTPVVGVTTAKILANSLFMHLRKLIAEEQSLHNQISSIYDDINLKSNQRQEALLQQLAKKEKRSGNEPRFSLPGKPDYFIGRAGLLADLHDLLSKEKNLLLVNGLGGIGKTTVAQAYMHHADYAKMYDHIAWVTVSGGLADALVAEIQNALQLDLQNITTAEQQLNAILVHWRTYPAKTCWCWTTPTTPMN